MTPVLELPTPTTRRAGAGVAGLEAASPERCGPERQRSGEIGYVHSWELVTAVDGPGTRMTLFLTGCPLRCLYCHNPDTWFRRDGTPVELSSVVARLERYRGVFAATGGGLTVSGGEPLQQPAFLARLLRAAKELGVSTAIDTSGYLGRACTDAMLDDTDLVLLDIKSGDPQTYRRVTGRELQPTLDFGRRLRERGVETWVRFVLVPGLTDDRDDVELVAEHAAAIGPSRVEVLPFHQMGADKWAARGLDYRLAGVRSPDPELLERVRGQFRARGLTVY